MFKREGRSSTYR